MPALCALGQKAALTHVDGSLQEGEMLFAFLNDIDPSNVGEIFLQVKQSLARLAGVQVNLRKTKVWNRAATRPEDLDIGAEAWRGEGQEEKQLLVVLGVPVGHSAFFFVRHPNASCPGRTVCVAAPLGARWTRANHILRNLPPRLKCRSSPKTMTQV